MSVINMNSHRERNFAKKLQRQSAAKVREHVTFAVRESADFGKSSLIEPLDYETEVVKNKTVLHNDPLREMLLFPYDDVSQAAIDRVSRTTTSSVPKGSTEKATNLFVKECIKTYTSEWNTIKYNYSSYSGSYQQLPKLKITRQISRTSV